MIDIASDPYALQLGFIGDTRAAYSDRLGPRYRAAWKIRRAAAYLQEISGTEALRLATNPDAVALAMRGISSGDTSAGLIG